MMVYVIDDDESVRSSIERLFLSLQMSVKTFATALQFLHADREAGTSCIILDLELPDLNGLELQEQIGADGPPIIFLSDHADVPRAVRAMKAGAVEFLTKPFTAETLVTAVRAALGKDACANVARREHSELRGRYETLTTREREVMAGIVAGLLNKQIAAALGTREPTVKEQRGQVMRKMEADSFAELVRMAQRLGIEPMRKSA